MAVLGAGDLGKALSTKYGPLPGYAWAGVAAGGIALVLFLRGKSGSSTVSTTGTSRSASPGATAPSYQPYPQPATAAQAATTKAGSTLRAGSSNPYLSQGGQVSLYQLVNGIMTPVTSVPWGTAISAAGDPQSYKYGQGSTGIFFPVASPIPGTYVSADDVTYGSGAAGIGGGKPAGSRSSRVMHYAHPDVKRAPRFTHFARVGGGAATHPSTIHSAAARAGVHPARLLMVNPSPRGYLRVA